MQDESIPPATFNLLTHLGRGGMSDVWQAEHRQLRIPVAIKILAGQYARDAWFHEVFRDEARAVAALHHPNIIRVLDYGRVSRQAQNWGKGRLTAGSPWLAMELLGGEGLRDQPVEHDWAWLRSTLLTLLDALGHAHARGVFHLDLKPGNVLLGSPASPGLRLVDFGLAHIVARDPRDRGEVRLFAGTPPYMAPEQLDDRWRAIGPWTDLYGLGCLATELCTGQPPFGWVTAEAATGAHQRQDPPPLKPLFDVPRGLEDWLRTLLEKDPARRFRRAADAAWYLRDLGRPSARAAGPMRGSSGQPRGSRCAPLPDSWRSDRQGRPRHPLPGAGLGLYGLRVPPLVGREQERDALWGAFHLAATTGRAQLRVLRGPAGCGKTRLCDWLGARTHELGVSTVLRASHGPHSSPAEGWVSALARQLGCQGLTPEASIEPLERFCRAHGVVEPSSWAAYAALLSSRTQDPKQSFAGQEERLGLGVQALRWLAEERPLLLVLDDAQWRAEPIQLASAILAAQRLTPFPITVLLTAQDEALLERPELAKALAALLDDERAETIPVPLLTPEECQDLVGALLGLKSDLVTRLRERVGGNPLFAVQLVADWVERGILEPGSGGFVLRPDAEVALPDDLHQFWAMRISHLALSISPQAPRALEAAAVLGSTVSMAEWQAACSALELELPDGFVEGMVTRRLWSRSEDGFSFANGMLRESLLRRCREADHWSALQRVCASVLEGFAAQRGVAIRRAEHLLEAGEHALALKPLLDAAEELMGGEDFGATEALLDRSVAVLRKLGLPSSDKRWGKITVFRADIAQRLGRYDEAKTQLAPVEGLARQHTWRGVLADTLAIRGEIHRQQGEPDSAWELFEEALYLYRALGRRPGAASSLYALGRVALQLGETARARRLQEQALKLQEDPRGRGAAMCLIALGWLDFIAGELPSAEDRYRQAHQIHETAGNRFGVAYALNQLAEVMRARGDLTHAAAAYRRSVGLFGALGSPQELVPTLNLGLTYVTLGRTEDARRIVEDIEGRLEALGWKTYLVFVHAILLAAAAKRGDSDAWERHFAPATTTAGGLAEPDLALCFERAAVYAAAVGMTQEAERAATVARELRQAIEREKAAAQPSG